MRRVRSRLTDLACRMSSAVRWALVLTSCLWLAWCMQGALAGIRFDHAPVTEWTLHPPEPGRDMRLLYAILDGRLDSDLVARSHENVAPIRFRAQRAALVFLAQPGGGIARLTHDHGGSFDLDLTTWRSSKVTKIVSLEGDRLEAEIDRTATAWRTAIALLPLLLLAACVRPWRGGRPFLLWTLGHVALLHLLAWLTQPVGFNSDGAATLANFQLLLSGTPAYFPPGYPTLLGSCACLSPDHGELLVTLLQHGLMLLSLFCIFDLARGVLGDGLASAALLLTGSLAPTVFLPQAILSENLALATMAGATWCAARPGKQNLVAAGLLLGLATITRAVPLPALLLPVLLLQWERSRLWPAVARTGVVLAIAVAVALLPASWNWLHSNDLVLSSGQGLHMFNRVVNEQRLVDPDAPSTAQLRAHLDGAPMVGVPHWEMSATLQRRGLSMAAAAELMGQVANDGLRANRLAFVQYSAGLAWRCYVADPMPMVPQWREGCAPWPWLEGEPLMRANGGALRWRDDMEWLFGKLWPWLLWAPWLAVVVMPLCANGRRRFFALLLVPVGYLAATSLVEFYLSRYVVCVLPFALMLALAPLAALRARD